jgi:hypothetical protein
MKVISIAVMVVALSSGNSAQVSSGGSYTLDHAVVTSGGGTSGEDEPNGFSLTATIAQPVAGRRSSGGTYRVDGGFWTPVFAPTAAAVTVSGRVLGTNDGPLRNIKITLFGGTFTTARVAYTGSLGYFSFEDVTVGQTYNVSVQNNKYIFANGVQTIGVMDEVTDIVFQAINEN